MERTETECGRVQLSQLESEHSSSSVHSAVAVHPVKVDTSKDMCFQNIIKNTSNARTLTLRIPRPPTHSVGGKTIYLKRYLFGRRNHDIGTLFAE